MSVIPRRSPRLAELAAKPHIPEPIVTVAPKPKRKSSVRPPPPTRDLTSDEIADELILRKQLLVEAKAIRQLLGQARTRDDFKVCHDRADALWYTANGLLTNIMDSMFISDCCRYCNEAKLGAIEHSYAIDVIKVYITCLENDISNPTTFVYIM
jgi:hypothetical protein